MVNQLIILSGYVLVGVVEWWVFESWKIEIGLKLKVLIWMERWWRCVCLSLWWWIMGWMARGRMRATTMRTDIDNWYGRTVDDGDEDRNGKNAQFCFLIHHLCQFRRLALLGRSDTAAPAQSVGAKSPADVRIQHGLHKNRESHELAKEPAAEEVGNGEGQRRSTLGKNDQWNCSLFFFHCDLGQYYGLYPPWKPKKPENLSYQTALPRFCSLI